MTRVDVILELGAGPSEVKRARRALAAALAGSGVGGDPADLAVLLVSELVTNALRHGSPPYRLRATVGRRLRVEVDDSAGPGRMAPRRGVDPDATGGRGLQLVEGLADRWGYGTSSSGKRVWFELDLAG